ncbi:MAG: M20/M25/M40 family metallo-hydrolase [Desulfurococcales archaeon]|nr:M20/M25/M40 family metallo-hydrolase [Desulfurococcales archaeon]
MKPSRDVLEPNTIAETLLELARIYSPPGREEDAAKAFVNRATGLGLDSWIDDIGNVYATQGGPWRVALVSHIDTVPGFLDAGIKSGYVYGRGVVDAKGPLSAMLHAAASTGRGVVVIGLVGEEDDSRGARRLLEEGVPTPYVIIGEPTGGSRVAVGYRGSLKLVVSCRDQGGHSSTPWLGGSALDRLLRVIEDLKEKYPGGTVLKPSVAVTGLCTDISRNILPASAKAWIDARIPPGGRTSSMASELLEVVESHGCSGEVLDPIEPVRVKPDSPVPRSLIRAILRNGMKPGIAIKAGTSDMNLLAGSVESIAAYGPGDPRYSHTMDERISIEELSIGARVYAMATAELLSL